MDIVAKVNRPTSVRKAQATFMDAVPTVLSASMDTEAIRLRLDTVKHHLMSIVEADRLYRANNKHSPEEASEYRRRQERLNAIRWEIGVLTPGTVQ